MAKKNYSEGGLGAMWMDGCDDANCLSASTAMAAGKWQLASFASCSSTAGRAQDDASMDGFWLGMDALATCLVALADGDNSPRRRTRPISKWLWPAGKT